MLRNKKGSEPLDFRVLSYKTGSSRLVVFVQILVEEVQGFGIPALCRIKDSGVKTGIGPGVFIIGVRVGNGRGILRGVDCVFFGLWFGQRIRAAMQVDAARAEQR